MRITFSNNQLIFKKVKSSVKVMNLQLSISEVTLKFVFLTNIPQYLKCRSVNLG